MNKTSIEWTDFTWNPIRARLKQMWPKRTGTFCTRISPGCTNCYASVINKRFGNGLEYTVPNLEKVEFYIDKRILEEPLHRKKPARIFVGDMFDLFHEAIDPFWIGAVFGMIMKAPQHTYQILTKRAARMREILSPFGAIDNVWLGVSVESQQYADERIPLLLQTPAAVRFLSVEPMLEGVDIRRYWDDRYIRGISWVICGGESGPGARPMQLEWAESLQQQCAAANVAFFMKQWGSNPLVGEFEWMKKTAHGWKAKARPWVSGTGFVPVALKDRKGGDPSEWPESLRVREFPNQKAKPVEVSA